jgi:hypothetical protein
VREMGRGNVGRSSRMSAHSKNRRLADSIGLNIERRGFGAAGHEARKAIDVGLLSEGPHARPVIVMRSHVFTPRDDYHRKDSLTAMPLDAPSQSKYLRPVWDGAAMAGFTRAVSVEIGRTGLFRDLG